MDRRTLFFDRADDFRHLPELKTIGLMHDYHGVRWLRPPTSRFTSRIFDVARRYIGPRILR